METHGGRCRVHKKRKKKMWRQLIWYTAQIQQALDAHTAPQAAGWLMWCNGSVWRQTSYRWLLHSCVWEGWKKHYGSASVHLHIYIRHSFMANNRERLDESLLETFVSPFSFSARAGMVCAQRILRMDIAGLFQCSRSATKKVETDKETRSSSEEMTWKMHFPFFFHSISLKSKKLKGETFF